MRLRSTLILAVVLIGLGAYIYFVESKQMAEEGKKEKLLAVEPDAVTAVTLVYPDREIALAKTETGWQLTKPVSARADDTAVKTLLRAMADAEVTKTIADPGSNLAQFGLAPPAATVELAAGDKTLPAIEVGKTTAVSNATYVKRADQPQVYLTAAAFHSTTDKQAKDLRDKVILALDEAAVTRIALRGPDGEVVLAKSGDKWNIEQPGNYPADATAVNSLLSSVRSLRATDFANDTPSEADLANYGLQPPQRQLVFATSDGREARLLLGNQTDTGLYVQAGDRPTVFVAGKWVAQDLGKGVNDLRDKTVLSFDPAAAGAVEVTRGGATPFVLISKDGKWFLEGSDQPLDEGAVSRFISTLSRLSGSKVLADAPPDLAAYGLAPPALTITVKNTEGAPIGTAEMGSVSPNPPATEYTAKRADRPTVFEVRQYQYQQLDKQPADFVAARTPVPTP